MIEIRTYDGSPDELAAFCTGIWQSRYRNHMPAATWTGPFMEWELFSDEPGARDFLVAAYDQGRLIGALPVKPVQYRWHGEPIAGSFGSYFATDPAYENQGVSLKLMLEQRRRHRDRQAQLFMGYVIKGASVAMGKEFWLRLQSVNIISELGIWARMIDHRALHDSLFSTRDRIAVRCLSWFQGPPREPKNPKGIRPYRETDLAECLRLVNGVSRSAEFGIVWDESTLKRQLLFKDLPRTLVAEENGRAAGLVNYFCLPIVGRREILMAVVDLVAVDELPLARQTDLLRAALRQMAADGCHIAFLLRVPGQPRRALYRAGFIPQPPEYYYVAQSMAPGAPSVKTRRVHALFR